MGLDVPGIISKPDSSTPGCFFCRDLSFKPYTEQSQYGLPACPLCPLVIILLANEPLSSPSPAQILAAAALLQPEQLSLISQQCWSWGLSPAGHGEEKISTKRPCFLPPLLLYKRKMLVAETVKAGFWMYTACTILHCISLLSTR